MRSRIEFQFTKFFASDRVGFAKTVNQFDIIALIDSVRDVSHLNLYARQKDIELRADEIPVLGNVNLELKRAK